MFAMNAFWTVSTYFSLGPNNTCSQLMECDEINSDRTDLFTFYITHQRRRRKKNEKKTVRFCEASLSSVCCKEIDHIAILITLILHAEFINNNEACNNKSNNSIEFFRLNNVYLFECGLDRFSAPMWNIEMFTIFVSLSCFVYCIWIAEHKKRFQFRYSIWKSDFTWPGWNSNTKEKPNCSFDNDVV